MTAQDAAALAGRRRAEGQSVVFTHGAFDLVHPGHLRFLQRAKGLGDLLIVGVHSDRSVHERTSGDRPFTPEAERAEILEALTCVDAAVIVDELATEDLIAAVQPDTLVAGSDWAETAVVGRALVETRGGRVVRVSREGAYSTTAILQQIRRSRPGVN